MGDPRSDPLGLTTGGGSPAQTSSGSVVEDLIRKQVETLAGYEKMSGAQKFFGGGAERRRALETLPGLIGARKDEAAQQAALTKNTLDFSKLVADHAEKFFSLSPEIQEQTRPLMQSIFTRGAKMANLPIDPGVIEQAFNTKGFAQKAIDLFFNDSAYTPDERQYWGTQMSSAKTPEARDKVLADAEGFATKRLTDAFRLTLPGMVAKAGGTPQQPLEVSQFARSMQQQFPAIGQSPLIARAFLAYVGDPKNAEELAGYGLKPGKVALAGQMKKEEQIASGPDLGQPIKDYLAGKGLTQATAKPADIEAARLAVEGQARERSALQGAASESEKRKLPMTPEERSKLTSVSALLQTGDLVQPPAGATMAEASGKGSDFVNVDDKQKEALRNLKPARQQLDIFQAMAKRVVTAETPAEAGIQGLKLYAGALTGANPEAKAYRDASEGFLGNLSRSVGGEKGVLTNQDIGRMRSAAIASFFDVAKSRDFKSAIINDIWSSAQQALVAEIAGKPAGEFRSQVQTLLKKLDDETSASLAKAIPGDHKLIINEQGQINVLPKREKTPGGWKDLR